MTAHSNKNLKKHIEDNAELLKKMDELTDQLQDQVQKDFEKNTGVPIPSVIQADVREMEYSMVYSSDPITDEYITGARTLLNSVFEADYPDVADRALDVVQNLVGNIVGNGTIQTGAHSESEMIPAGSKHGKIVCAGFTQIEECNSKDWLTDTNFYVSFYVYVVWQPSLQQLQAMKTVEPALA